MVLEKIVLENHYIVQIQMHVIMVETMVLVYIMVLKKIVMENLYIVPILRLVIQMN